MQSFKKWGLLPLLAILLFSLMATACGNTSTNTGGNDSASAGGSDAASGNAAKDAKFPITIKHDKGETVLNEKPKKVAITYFPYADHLFAIGEQDVVAGVVGLKSLQNFPVYDPYTKQDKIADLGDTASMESILALDPDVIIAWEDDEKIYDQLSKIAPTILIRQSENWQDTIEKVAAVIGEEDKAKQYIADYNAKLDALAAKMDETGAKGKTAIFMMTWGKGFNYYGGVRMERITIAWASPNSMAWRTGRKSAWRAWPTSTRITFSSGRISPAPRSSHWTNLPIIRSGTG